MQARWHSARLKRCFASLPILIAIAAMPATADEMPVGERRAVAEIARVFLAYPMAQGFAWEARQPALEMTGEARQCVDRAPAAEIGKALEAALEVDLTAKQIAQADAFLESEAGKAFERLMEARDELRGVPGAWSKGALSEAEDAQLRKFATTFVGNRLLRVLFLPEVLRAQAEYRATLFTRCGSEVVPARLARSSGSHAGACTRARVFYPPDTRDAEGTVVVRLVTNPDGFVVKTTVEKSSGSPVFDFEAQRAVYAMRCEPYVKDGQRVAVTALQPIAFAPRSGGN